MIYAMHQWESELVQLFVVALLLQDSFGINLNSKNMSLVKTGIQKRVMTKDMQPVQAIKEEWDNKAIEAAIVKSQKGGKIVPKNKVSVYSDKIAKGKKETERVSEEQAAASQSGLFVKHMYALADSIGSQIVNQESFNIVLKIFKKFNLGEEQAQRRWGADEPESKIAKANALLVKLYSEEGRN